MGMFMVYLVIAVCAMSLCSGSLYDPHVSPVRGPFFEGWYMRFTDTPNQRTFGVLFGHVVPQNVENSSNTVFMGLIYDDAETSNLTSRHVFPPQSLINLTLADGAPVTANPTVAGPANFRWSAGEYGYVEVGALGAEVNVTVGGMRFEACTGPSVPWDPAHQGPMGWLLNMPLTPLFWFVYSLRSPVLHYRFHNMDTGEEVTGTSGTVHMEKNWGRSFPAAWIWTQGIRPDSVSYALGFGPVAFGPVSIPGHLGGYRNPNKDININFRPDNSYLSHTLQACDGTAKVTITSLLYKLVIDISADPKTFSCLYGPMENGFRKVCSESFKASAVIDLYKRRWFGWVQVDSQTIPQSALEFGGSFLCQGQC